MGVLAAESGIGRGEDDDAKAYARGGLLVDLASDEVVVSGRDGKAAVAGSVGKARGKLQSIHIDAVQNRSEIGLAQARDEAKLPEEGLRDRIGAGLRAALERQETHDRAYRRRASGGRQSYQAEHQGDGSSIHARCALRQIPRAVLRWLPASPSRNLPACRVRWCLADFAPLRVRQYGSDENP